MAKMASGSKLVCEHEPVLIYVEPRMKICRKCQRFWPNPHPAVKKEEIPILLDHTLFVNSEKRKRKKQREEFIFGSHRRSTELRSWVINTLRKDVEIARSTNQSMIFTKAVLVEGTATVGRAAEFAIERGPLKIGLRKL